MITGPILLLLHNDLRFDDLLSLEKIMPVVNIHDSFFRTRIQGNAGDVILVNLGALPIVVFEPLFKESLYPPLLEGMSSEAMMFNLGRPYLDCGDDGWPSDSYIQQYIDRYPNVNNKTKKLIKAMGDLCLHGKKTPALKKAVVQYVIDSWDPKSKLRLLLDKVKHSYNEAGDRYLHAVAARLSNVSAVISASPPPLLKKSFSFEFNCSDIHDIQPLLVRGEPGQISKCLEERGFDLTSIVHPNVLVFFMLIVNEKLGIRELITKYLSQNLNMCEIFSRNHQCLRLMRDISLMGREQSATVKTIFHYCQPSLNQYSLQDAISIFCGEELFSLVPAKDAAYKLIQFLTLNLTQPHLPLLDNGKTGISSFKSSEGFIWFGIALSAGTILAAIGYRQGGNLIKFLQAGGEWLWGRCRRQHRQEQQEQESLNYKMEKIF